MNGSGEVSFGTLCANNVFLIPPEQREYVWNQIDITTLLDDILEHHSMTGGCDGAQGMPGEYDGEQDGKYIGAIIALVENINSDEGVHRLTIYDGQQRITTLLIFMAALVNYLKKYMSKMSEQNIRLFNKIQQGFVQDIEVCGSGNITDLNRITPHYEYEVVFFENLKKGIAPIQLKGNSLVSAYETCLSFLENNFEDDIDGVCRFAASVGYKTEFTLVKRHTAEVARKVFLSLNSTGKGLEAIDLFRGYLISNALNSKDDIDTIRQLWTDMFKTFNGNMRLHSNFMEGYVNTLIPNTHVKMNRGMGKYTSHITYDNIYRACFSKGNEIIQFDETRSSKVLFSTPLDCMTDIEKFFNHYSDLREGRYYRREGISLFSSLVRPASAPVSPIYTSIYATLLKKFPEHIDQLSDLMGRYILLVRATRGHRRSSPAYATKFEEIRNKVLEGMGINEVIDSLINVSSYGEDIDETYFDGAGRMSFLDASFKKRLLRIIYILTQNRSGGKLVDIGDNKKYHIEHCSPKTNNAQYKDRLGNLFVLESSANTSAKDKVLSDKLAYYRSSDLLLTKMVCPNEASDILRRSNSPPYLRIIAEIYQDVYANMQPYSAESEWTKKEVENREIFYKKVLQEHLRHIVSEARKISHRDIRV